MEDDALEWIDRTSDFQIIGDDPGGQATELHKALRLAGYESRHLLMSTEQWMRGGGEASPALLSCLEKCRASVFFYSESQARAARIYQDEEFLTGHLTAAMLMAMSFAPTLVIVIDGKWPLPASPIPVIELPKGGTAVVVATLFGILGVAFFARRLEEAQQDSLARLFRNGLVKATGGRKLHVFVFGPGRPEDTFSARLSFEGMLWLAREAVRRELDACGVVSVYGEDLETMAASKVELKLNPSLKERIFATKVDVILFLAGSVGSAAELGVFSQHPELCAKAQVWVCEDHEGGFMAKGPAQEAVNFGASLEVYSRADLNNRRLEQLIMDGVRRKLEGWAAKELPKNTQN